MQCKVDGCDRPARYKAACLCQLHYFRIRRGGTTEMVRKEARPRYEDDRGYQFVYEPSHPLITKGQFYVPEHRKVLFEALGNSPMSCAICSKPLTWKTCCVDHIDENPRNNSRDNLRPTCMPCNARRGQKEPVEWSWTHKLTLYGETKTPSEWARDPRINVASTTILLRKRRGFSDEEALLSPKQTHNGKIPKPYVPKTQAKHERSNAVAITVNGVTKTAAEWAREPGVTVGAAGLIWRIRSGWSPERAVYQPGRFAIAKLRELKRQEA